MKDVKFAFHEEMLGIYEKEKRNADTMQLGSFKR